MRYSFDTNALIQPWHNRYPIDLMPDYWEDIDRLAREDVLFISEEVVKEIEAIDDDLHE